MRDTPMSILAIFAHPDDEIGAASTLAYYSDRGAITVLACASRGEAATIYCEDCATPENLADVRTHELECAVRHIGMTDLRWLGWADGGIPDLPREAAVRQIVALIRTIQPDILITHPEHGLYPHPDHLAMWEIVRSAFEAAANAERYPDAGAPWAPARLFTRVIAQSHFDAAPVFAEYRVALNGDLLPFYGTPDEDIDVIMQVAPWAHRRQAAWACHRSQHNPEGAFSQVPEDVRQAMAENEEFVLAEARLPLPAGGRHDLFAGLESWPQPAGPEQEYADLLRANFSAHLAYLRLDEASLAGEIKPSYQELLQDVIESEKEIVYLLASALRRAGESVQAVQPDARVLAQSKALPKYASQVRFQLARVRHAVARYQALVNLSVRQPETEDLWKNLLMIAEKQLATVTSYAQSV